MDTYLCSSDENSLNTFQKGRKKKKRKKNCARNGRGTMLASANGVRIKPLLIPGMFRDEGQSANTDPGCLSHRNIGTSMWDACTRMFTDFSYD